MLLLSKRMPDARLYVPAVRKTTWPLWHAAMALLIWAAVAPGPSVEQIVVRDGMPPGMPSCLQSTLRLAATMVCCAWAYVEKHVNTRQIQIAGRDLIQVLPTITETAQPVANRPQG